MDDVTRPRGDGAEGLEAARAAVAGLAGELTHLVLGLFRSRGISLSERITLAGGDPFEVIDVFVVTLRALAEGLENPDPAWLRLLRCLRVTWRSGDGTILPVVRRWGAAAAVLTLMFASTAPAGAADTEIPSAKKVAKVAVKDNGPEAIAFTFLALDRGYSPRQLVEGVLDHGLEPTGEITEQDGTVVEPVGPPVGVIIDDVDGADSSLPGDDLGGSVSLQTIVDEVPDSRAKAKLMLASIILGAAVGYPLDDLIAEGFLEERFTGLGAITGQRRPKPPDPDFLDDLLVGIGGAKDKPKPGGGEAATSFVGKLVQAGPWGDLYAPAVPAVADSGIDLRIKGERLIGTYSVLLEIPQVGGTCGSTMSFDGKFDLASDEVGYSGVATGTGTVFSNGREGCPGDQTFDAHWNTTVARTSDDRLSGTMDWQAHPGLQFTFEATAG